MLIGAAALTLLGGAHSRLSAQRIDTVSTAVLAPGIVYQHLVAPDGPWSINVVSIDLTRPGVAIDALRADDSRRGRETVSSMVRRHAGDSRRIVAAVNADFFNLASGENEDDQVIGGEVWRGEPLTDAPQEHARSVRSQFAIDGSGRPLIERFVFRGTVQRRGAPSVPLDAVNVIPDSNALVLFTPRYGDSLRGAALAGNAAELPMQSATRSGDTLWLVPAGAAVHGSVAIPAGGVLAGFGRAARSVATIAAGTGPVAVVERFWPGHRPLRVVVGGWGRLVAGGRNVADSTDADEGTAPGFSVTQHPRTGIGFSRDSNTVFLVTVDGRQESSSGMSLDQFAALMLELGISDGMNLDGGGSTTMVIGDSVVNHPSDRGGERAVGSALIVTIAGTRP